MIGSFPLSLNDYRSTDDVGSDITGTLTYFGSPSAKAKEPIRRRPRGPAAGLDGAQADPLGIRHGLRCRNSRDGAQDDSEDRRQRSSHRLQPNAALAAAVSLKAPQPACSRCAWKQGPSKAVQWVLSGGGPNTVWSHVKHVQVVCPPPWPRQA
jgi:hypothetical protein